MATSIRYELWSWVAVLVMMNALYLYGAFVSTADPFGIDALRFTGGARYALFAALGLGAAVLLDRVGPSTFIDRRAFAAVVAVCSWPVFFLFRSNLLNTDGNMLTPKFEADVPQLGAHVTHDELLELFLHSKFWHYTHEWWGWSVVFSYQVVSCIAGSLFIYALMRLAPRLAPTRAWLVLAGAFSGGYMQLFFGDVENYTMTAALVACYVLAACRFLAGEVGLWLPTLVLAVAMCFHLEAAWLMPSLLYVFARARSRHVDSHELAISIAGGAVVVVATVMYFHFNGLPLRRFVSSHAGQALRMNDVFAIGMPFSYYLEQLNLLLLLCPAIAMIAPLVAWRRLGRDEVTVFLAIAAGSLLLLQVVWRAQLGVFDDWNLYAIGGMLASVFIWRGIASAATTVPMGVAAAALAATGWLHTYAWIIANHQHGR